MEGFSVTTERVVTTGGAVADVGAALTGEIATMTGLLDELGAGWQSSDAAPRFVAAMSAHLEQATVLKDALLSHGESLMLAGRRYAETEAAIAAGIPAVA